MNHAEWEALYRIAAWSWSSWSKHFSQNYPSNVIESSSFRKVLKYYETLLLLSTIMIHHVFLTSPSRAPQQDSLCKRTSICIPMYHAPNKINKDLQLEWLISLRPIPKIPKCPWRTLPAVNSPIHMLKSTTWWNRFLMIPLERSNLHEFSVRHYKNLNFWPVPSMGVSINGATPIAGWFIVYRCL